MQIEFKIEGLDELKAAFLAAPGKVVQEMSAAVQKAVVVVQSTAIKEAPVNKQGGGGTLRQSIKGRMISRLEGEVEATANYASAVETGTRPHIIRAVRAGGLANRRTGQFFGKVVHHPGTKANPYMERAVEKAKDQVDGFVTVAVDNVLKTFPK